MLNDIKVLDFGKDIEFSDDIKPKLEIKEDQKTVKLHLENIKNENVVVHNDNNDILEDMEKDEQHKKDITGIEHGMFIEGRNTKKNISYTLQHFSCLLT